MRRRAKHTDDQAEVNMTPMLDIVFILLIFFIVTATFLSEEGIDMRPPADTPPDSNTPASPPILVQVDEDNNIFVNQVRTDVDRVLSAVNRKIRAARFWSMSRMKPTTVSLSRSGTRWVPMAFRSRSSATKKTVRTGEVQYGAPC